MLLLKATRLKKDTGVGVLIDTFKIVSLYILKNY